MAGIYDSHQLFRLCVLSLYQPIAKHFYDYFVHILNAKLFVCSCIRLYMCVYIQCTMWFNLRLANYAGNGIKYNYLYVCILTYIIIGVSL